MLSRLCDKLGIRLGPQHDNILDTCSKLMQDRFHVNAYHARGHGSACRLENDVTMVLSGHGSGEYAEALFSRTKPN